MSASREPLGAAGVARLLAEVEAAAGPPVAGDKLRKHLIRAAAVAFGARGCDVADALGLAPGTVANSRTYVAAYGRDRLHDLLDRVTSRILARRIEPPPLPNLTAAQPGGARACMGAEPGRTQPPRAQRRPCAVCGRMVETWLRDARCPKHREEGRQWG